jgi:hypothetical protein
VAKEYKIPKGTISNWKKTAAGMVEEGGVREDRTQKADMGGLLLELLEKNIRSLIAMSEVASDKEWLKKQGGAEFATLFGVKHDKAVRMIEALNSSDDAT